MSFAPVLVAEWSGADFGAATTLTDTGALPCLTRLRGGATVSLTPAYPAVPALLWNTAVTGYTADRHGVFGAWGVDDATQTVVPATRQVPAVWDTVREAGGVAHVCGDFGDESEPVPALTLTARDIAPAVLLSFVPRAAEVDQRADNRLVVLAEALAAAFTRHNHATLALETPFALAVVRYDLLTRLAPVFGSEPAESLYNGVIPGAYRLLDLFLTRLLHLAGSDVTTLVYAPHGNETEPGVYAAGLARLGGAAIHPGVTVRGGTLYDLAPTVLTLCGVSASNDLPGRVWGEAWQVAPKIYAVPPPSFEPRCFSPVADTPPYNTVRRINDWNRAQVLFETGRAAEAISLLDNLRRESPEAPVTLLLAQCLLATGAARNAEIVLSAQVMTKETPFARYLLAVAVLAQKRDAGEGIAHLRAAEAGAENEPPAFWVRVGQAYFQARQIGDARRAFEQVVRRAPNSDAGYLGLAGCAILRRDLEDAVLYAQKTLELRAESPFAHLILGRAYEWLSHPAAAAASYEAALAVVPGFGFVHRSLAHLYDRLEGGAAQAEFHRKRFHELKHGANFRH